MMESSNTVEEPDLNQSDNKKPNHTKLPSNALTLYIKLYCSKKYSTGSKHTVNVIEATKSWITLCEKEKQQFYNKYKECQRKHMQIVGNCLQNAEPYMKKKKNTGSKAENFLGTSIDQETNITIDEKQTTLKTSEEEDNSIDTTLHKTEIDDNNIFYNEIDQTIMESDIGNDQVHLPQEHSNIFYSEPIPPSIKTGKELFEIKKLIDKDNGSTWASLPNQEKCHYNRAVLTLKRDYIMKYKEYLEHLSKRELFDYYNKTFH